MKEEEEFRYKQILLTSHSSVNDLPDSDGKLFIAICAEKEKELVQGLPTCGDSCAEMTCRKGKIDTSFGAGAHRLHDFEIGITIYRVYPSSSEEKNVALKSIQSVIALRLETVQKILAAVTPGKRKRSRSGSSLQLVPGAGYQRKRSGSIDSSASYSSLGPVVLSGLNRALLSPTFKPENETLPEDIEC